ncbi:MAG: leucine-rich repeat protein [Bacteroidales bacterium]|nr:leucine-rich repeat protein [Bacteroidales bacterium]
MKTKKQNQIIITAILMALAMTFVPINIMQAQTVAIVADGQAGNVNWTLNDAGTLTISGTAAMPGFTGFTLQPWWDFRAFITEIVIEEGVTSIGNHVFGNLANVRTLRLPASLNTVGLAGLEGLVSLENIFIAENNVAGFHDIDGVWFHNDTILFRYPVGRTASSFTIPDGVTVIHTSAFFNHATDAWAQGQIVRNLTSVTIPEGVHTINHNAFHSSGLTTVTLPSTLITLGGNAFMNSRDLAGAIVIPGGVATIPAGAFANTAITSVTIPEGVNTIAGQITLPSTITATATTQNGAFTGTQLTTIHLPASLTSLGADALHIPTLQTITVAAGNAHFVAVDDVLYLRHPATGTIQSYRIARYPSARPGTTWAIPPSINVGGTDFPVTGINSAAFLGNTTLTTVDFSNIAATFESIGNHAFAWTELTSVTIPDSTEANPHSLWHIGAGAFFDATSLTTVQLPNTLTTLGNDVFRNCSTLVSINLPIGITGLGTAATARGFLGNHIFHSCVALTTVALPENLVFLSTGMFFNSGLTSITIPERVNGIRAGETAAVPRIGANAFTRTPLTELTVEWAEPPLQQAGNGNIALNAFDYVDVRRVTLNTPATATAAYRAAPFWQDFAFSAPQTGTIAGGDIIWECFDNGLLVISGTGPMENFTIDGDGTTAPWNVCRSTVTTIVIDTAITSIGAYAFRGFDDLSTVTIPNTVQTIGNYAFAVNAVTPMLGTVNVSWTDPITIGANVFDGIPLLGVTLNVTPATRAITYFHAPVWGDFMIAGLDTEAAGNLTWAFENGVLHIIGTGDMDDYEFNEFLGTTAPWAEHRTAIRTVNIGEGVTSIGANAFLNHTALTVVTIPSSVTEIGDFAFMGCRSLRVVNVNSTTPPNLGAAVFGGVTLPQTFLFVPEGYDAVYRDVGAPWNAFNGHTVIRGVAPVITSAVSFVATPRRATVGVPFTETLTATSTLQPGHVPADALQWSVDGAAAVNRLPAGLSLTRAGVLSGTPTEAGVFTFTVWASNVTGRISRNFTFEIAPSPDVPVITTATLAGGEVGIAYTETLLASGAVSTWALSGNVPHGLSLNKETGVLSGTPTTAGEFTFEVVATNDWGRVEAPFTITIIGTSFADLVTELNLEIDRLDGKIYSLQGEVDSLQGEVDLLQLALDACLAAGTSNSPHIPMEQVSIYPNPVTSELNIINFDWTAGDVVELFDMNGRRVFMERVNAPVDTFTINMSMFQSGAYILRIGNRIARVVKQ